MARVRQAPGGGTIVEVEPRRLPGWVTRFAERHGAVAVTDTSLSSVTLTADDGATAVMVAPLGPMDPTGAEPVEAVIRHTSDMGDVAAILVRARAYSVGVVRAGRVITSSTDTRYAQGRTKAGGWSQQRYARRRGNQRRDSYRAAIDAALKVVQGHQGPFDGLVVGGDAVAIREVLADPRLATLAALPRRAFTDIPEPRRAVLDAVAQRYLTIEITVRESGATSRT